MPVLRLADDDDWQVYTGLPPPPHWIGYVVENDHMILGLGGVYYGEDGRWWMTLSRAPGVRMTKTLMIAAKKVCGHVAAAEIKASAVAHPEIAGAELLLSRLGFTPTDETYGGLPIWVQK